MNFFTTKSLTPDTCAITGLVGNVANLVIPSELVKSGKKCRVTLIAEGAFARRKDVVTVSLPEGLEEVGESAFSGCPNLQSVSFPTSLKLVRREAFGHCGKLENVALPAAAVTIEGYAFCDCPRLLELTLPKSLNRVDKEAFRNTPVRALIIPEGVEVVQAGFFSDFGRLARVVFPSTLKEIGKNAFSNCSYLMEVKFPHALTTIGEYAFYNCAKLQELSLPASLKTVGRFAFANCTGLKNVAVGGYLNLDDSVFANTAVKVDPKEKDAPSDVPADKVEKCVLDFIPRWSRNEMPSLHLCTYDCQTLHYVDGKLEELVALLYSCEKCNVAYDFRTYNGYDDEYAYFKRRGLSISDLDYFYYNCSDKKVLFKIPQHLRQKVAEYVKENKCLDIYGSFEDVVYNALYADGAGVSTAVGNGTTTACETAEKALDLLNRETLAPFLRLKLQSRKVSLCGSKVGGLPYVPSKEAIPLYSDGVPLRLLAQIDCKELSYLPDFPQTGLLQFWISQSSNDGNGLFEEGGSHVVWYETVDESVSEEMVRAWFNELPQPDSDDVDNFPVQGEFAISFSPDKEPMNMLDARFEPLFVQKFNSLSSGGELEHYNDLPDVVRDWISDKSASGDGHKIGGYPAFCQEDPREDISSMSVLLLQIDSDDVFDEGEIVWGDSGVCNFFCSLDELRRRDFSNVLYNWDCC
ncbi:MAG: DUF1963 domain-containing protein [Paludibacteraceae bacterium]|nr:DUF1963 domain-containing protein [Paludibacteraceae bacterium]